MTALLVTAGIILAAIIFGSVAFAVIDQRQESLWRREEGRAAAARGRHRAPKAQPAAVSVRADRVIEPAAVTGHPPWEPEPEPEAEPKAWFIAAATLRGGQVTSVQYAAGVEQPGHWDGPPLPRPVTDVLRHPTVEEALESMWDRAQALELREITDGAS